ncbi:hypothetical protein [Antrihabitans sp. YC2-6]|uniref:hypothetical protein n=1 Tax=Antrihabitans sp. YC2-6 TaxID=2799498 RepID=UPI0018F3B53F|nr:hypothetical protein [Antrihabitans sp. YC2-6]MBJ8343975.1 hypothetical protein [Antrihabitans sp. YC2-6]
MKDTISISLGLIQGIIGTLVILGVLPIIAVAWLWAVMGFILFALMLSVTMVMVFTKDGDRQDY